MADYGVNVIPDPGFDAGITGWSGGNATLSWGQSAGHTAPGELLAAATGSGSGVNAVYDTAAAADPGQNIEAAAWVRHAAAAAASFRVHPRFYLAGGGIVDAASAAVDVAPNTWTRLRSNTAAPAGTTGMTMRILGFRNTTPAAGTTYEIDDVSLALQRPVTLVTADGTRAAYTEIQQWPERVKERTYSNLAVQGRADPVVLFDVVRFSTSTITLLTRTVADYTAILSTLSANQPLIISAPCPGVNLTGDVTAMVLRFVERRLTNRGDDVRRLWDVDIQAVTL